MFKGHNVARPRCEFAADLAAPRPVFEGLSRPCRLVNWRNVLPALVVAWTVSTMQRVENAKRRLSRSIEDLHHMRNTLIRFSNTLQAIPYFAACGNEIVVRIDDEKRSAVFVKFQICHVLSVYASTNRSLCAG